MLSRYKIYRGKRPENEPLPDGIRQDSRKHTRHCLRPPTELVERYLKDPSAEAWKGFQREYLKALDRRLADDPAPFRELAALAAAGDVYLGCNCPTKRNPDPSRCHTVLALSYMAQRFPELKVVSPRPE